MSRTLSLGLVATLAVSLGGCFSSTGDFDGLSFAPGRTAFAIADRHTLVERSGRVVATRRPDAQMSLVLFFSSAWASANDEWRRLPADRLTDLRKTFATTDGLLIEGLPLGDVTAGATFEVRPPSETDPDDDGAADFRPHLVVDPGALAASGRGLGSDVSYTLNIDSISLDPGGVVAGALEIKRDRGADQTGDLATGTVTLTFQVPFAAERRAKSNLSIAGPIFRCAAAVGPSQAGACRNQSPDRYLDATGVVTGGD